MSSQFRPLAIAAAQKAHKAEQEAVRIQRTYGQDAVARIMAESDQKYRTATAQVEWELRKAAAYGIVALLEELEG